MSYKVAAKSKIVLIIGKLFSIFILHNTNRKTTYGNEFIYKKKDILQMCLPLFKNVFEFLRFN